MTKNQRIFADEYLIDRNATRAYKAAYPKIKNTETARKNGSRLLTYADVKAYIDGQLEKLSSEKTATAREIMEYLTAVMRGEAETEMIVAENKAFPSLQRIMRKPDERERLRAAELLAKLLGMFAEKKDDNAETLAKLDDVLAKITGDV